MIINIKYEDYNNLLTFIKINIIYDKIAMTNNIKLKIIT